MRQRLQTPLFRAGNNLHTIAFVFFNNWRSTRNSVSQTQVANRAEV